ncbi:aminotransferase class V-fold PLP-dependent enzyme [Thermostaphylospora chromogena]|uniref:Selenocysteine lyase/Cysteine desulfurase n=1 Tax=Thermostaphylospora chromogena TaxID=35622 RepID=A0A1H1GDE0_9ACTN|nr:aminotransferase class V-fold PLP-dependent enzyme [Thermostaphylospora chromogena]SDR11187.1 Selenocysteine lyase/Cysteine desulfurase [Thermostaphylospora chromogena]
MTAFTPEDVARARAETPGCEKVVHLNNAGAALPPRCVTDTVIDHLRTEALIGGYEAADAAAPRLAGVKESIATLLNATAADIGLTDSASRAWQAVFYAIPFRPGDRILTCRSEYTANIIALLQVAARTGAVVEVVDDDENGQIDLDDLRSRLDERVRLIALTHVPAHGGLVNPAEEVGRIAREAGVTYLLDACQSAGQMPLDVERLGCDALTVAGRKFLRGPRGTGFLYVHPRLRQAVEPAMLDLHSAAWTGPDSYEVHPDAQRFEVWERNVAAVLGLGAAVDYALSWGITAIEERVSRLAEHLREELSAVPGVTVCDRGARRCGIVTFTVDGVQATRVKASLSEQGINTTVSYAANARYDLPVRGLGDLVRASVHYYNTEEELGRLTEAVAALARTA